jgi:hypothetical protein
MESWLSKDRISVFPKASRTKGEFGMDWRLIFELSPINGGLYTGDELTPRVFKTVTDSWFQKRLAHVRAELKREILEESNRVAKDYPVALTDWNPYKAKRESRT